MQLLDWQAKALKGLMDPVGPTVTSVLGGIGVGKTWWLAMALYVVAKTRPGARLALSSDTYQRLLRVNRPALDTFFGAENYKGSPHNRYQLPNGTTLSLLGYQMPSGQDEAANPWEGLDLHLLITDETQILPGTIFGHSLGRARQPCKDLNGVVHEPKVVWVGRPGAIRHWLEETERLAQEGSIKTAIYKPMTHENPHNGSNYLAQLKAQYSPAEFDALTKGFEMPTSGAIYSSFSTKTYPEGNLIDFPLDKTRPTQIGLDFGFTNPAVVFVQKHPVLRNTWVLVDELKLTNALTPQMVKAILAKGYNLTEAFVDPAGSNTNVQTGQTDIQLLRRAEDYIDPLLGGGLGIPIRFTRVPQRTSIANGISRLQALICNANGERRLLFDRTLWQNSKTHGIRESILTYAYGPDGIPKKGARGNQADHMADALRYWTINAAWSFDAVEPDSPKPNTPTLTNRSPTRRAPIGRR